MFDPGFNVFDFILFKEILKPAIGLSVFVSLIGIELSSVIGHHLTDTSQPAKVVHCLLHELNAVLSRLCVEFVARQNATRTIIENCAHLLPIVFAGVPIQMHQC
jgi:hypothetical protein